MNLIILNGSPVVIFNTDFKLTKEERKNILNLKYHNDKYESSPLVSDDVFIFNNKKLKRIEKIMFEYVNKYKNEILKINDDLRVVHSWITKNDNTNHTKHAHKNSFISCSFYLENEGDNKLIFSVEKSALEKCHFFHYKIKEYNFFNSSSWTIDLNKGDVVIFLSDLCHQSINKGKKIMVGANYFLTGEIGDVKNYTYLKI
jgi:hypothetical protein